MANEDPRQKSTRCYLLELPAELRTQIWELLIHPVDITLTLPPDASATKWRTVAGVSTLYFGFQYLDGDFHARILQTCRQIYDEAGMLLYRPEFLSLQPSLQPDGHGSRSSSTVDVRQFSIARALPCLALVLIFPTTMVSEDSLRLEALIKTWLRTCKVQNFWLSIEDQSFSDEGNFSYERLFDLILSWLNRVDSDEATVSVWSRRVDDVVGRWQKAKTGDWEQLERSVGVTEEDLWDGKYTPERLKAILDALQQMSTSHRE